jgi:outer membrane protein OmpA-like peptidoglycan-associated protein
VGTDGDSYRKNSSRRNDWRIVVKNARNYLVLNNLGMSKPKSMYYSRLLVSLGFLCFFTNAISQDLKELPPGYYVVVGAYAPSQERMARQYVDDLKTRGHDAEYGFNSTKKFYFVYLKYFNDFGKSVAEMENTRDAGTFTDAWVRVVPGMQPAPPPTTAVADSSLPPGVVRTAALPSPPAPPVETLPAVIAAPATVEKEVDQVVDSAPVEKTMESGDKEVFLSLVNSRNNKGVEGDVAVIDTERARLITKAKGNEYLDLPDPKSKSGQLTLICDVFGYRKMQQEINYPLAITDSTQEFIEVRDSAVVINFNLVRYHAGDIATLYNVYFYNDASVMLPESKYELNSLLQLLQENPRYRIRLHGHTNGNYHGKMITMGPEKNFFSLTGSVKGIGSARQLSYNRAEIVKDYMTSLGIDPSRMELKGWGGRRPIYDKNSANAKRNVRVAVEILQD